jgi:predicted porin
MGAIVAGGGATAGSGLNVNEDSLAGAFSLAGIYNNGPFYASLAYESLDADMFMNSQTSLRGSAACIEADGTPTPSCNYINDSYDKWRVGLGLLDWNGFTLTGIYEQQDNIPSGQQRQAVTYIDADGQVFLGTADTVEKQSLWQIQAAYAFGNNTVKAMYGSVDRSNAGSFATNLNETISINNLKKDLEGDRYSWAIGFDHNFSKRTKAYVLYTQVDDDLSGNPMYPGIEWSGFSAGMMHSF